LKEENTNYIKYLVDLAQSGRPRAFIELASINLNNIFTVSYRLIYDYKIAEEVTVKTLMRAWETIILFEPSDSFALWIKNIAVEYSVDELFQRGSRMEQRVRSSGTRSDEDRLENLILKLPVEDRIIFILHDLEGFSYSEINPYFRDMIIDELKTIVIRTRNYLMENLGL
jgi:RNA polymerase sigma-70 factor (ECF subfamily)